MTALADIVKHATGLRHRIHRQPELGYQEHQTAKLVRAELDRLGIPWQACAETGTLGRLAPKATGKHLAFRADLDALPVQELTKLPYASEREGHMHACGHDGHTASLLGAAAYLKSREKDLPGPVTLLFQPAEEGGHGAKRMIEEGALTGIDEVYGYHNWPPFAQGTAGCIGGTILASNGEFVATVTGRGGHASMPHQSIDPLVTAATFVTMVQQVVSRQVSPIEAGVISVTTFHGGTANNVIPDAIELSGTVRAVTTALRDELARKTGEILDAACRISGCKASFTYRPCYPATVNDHACAAKAAAAIERAMGKGAVFTNALPIMGAEDFSYYLQERPGTYFLLGGGKPGTTMEPCHSPRFDYNDALIPYVVKIWADLAGVPVDGGAT
ncbi:MAG: amidohydrolase [Planctomycetes bacterium]|nr:amidohydrolase [Planctomycetota bacterium]